MKQDIDAIENVQKFALHVCLKSWDCSYDQLLIQASLLSMQERRNFTSLCHLYKIFKGMTHFPDPPLEQHTSSYNTRSTSSITFSVPRFRTNGYKFSFFPRAIKLWNTLPPELFQQTTSDGEDDSHTVLAFKRNLLTYLTQTN